MPFYKNFGQKGITLVEVIIATFILLVAIVGSYLAFSKILMATSASSDRLVAAYLAQEGIEIIRNIRDANWLKASNWKNILSTCSDGCQVDYKTGTSDDPVASLPVYGSGTFLNIDSNGFYTYGSGTSTIFKRKITIVPGAAPLDADELDVLVSVMWDDRGQLYKFDAKESLYNWK